VPDISVIVCTRNRAKSLGKCFEALLALKLEGIALELIVVDNGSSDDTKSVISELQNRALFPVRYIHEPKTGLSHARNSGLNQSSADVILFTDDDCYVAPDWVQAAAGIFRTGEPKLVGGRIELFNKKHLPITIKTDMVGEQLASTASIFGFIHGANFGFTRAVVNAIGLFDVRLGAGTKLKAAEDTDFVYRAFVAGIPVFYDPSMAVSHDHGRSTQQEKHHIEHGYRVGQGAMLAKYALAGRTDLVRPIYWNMRTEMRVTRRKAAVLLSRLAVIGGGLRYLLEAARGQ